MKVLITGGFGFIGGRLAIHLSKLGHSVVLGSRRRQSAPVWLKDARSVEIEWNTELSLLKASQGVDCIIHAAGMNAQDCTADPAEAIRINGLGTAKLVAAATKNKVKKMIYLSTAHVYKNKLAGNIGENTCPRNLHPYATSNLIGENSLLYAHLQRKIQGVVFRLSNTFGSPAHKEVNAWMLFVNDICCQAIQTQAIVLGSEGIQHRDFIGMNAITSTICSTVERSYSFENNSLFNLGSGRSMSIFDMAKLVAFRYKLMFGHEVEVRRGPLVEGEASEPIFYSVNSLRDNGLFHETNFEREVDDLLRFCKANFN